MLQELDMASVTSRGACDLVSLWAELRMAFTSVIATRAPVLFAPVGLRHCYTTLVFTTLEKIYQYKEIVLGIVFREKMQSSGVPFDYRRDNCGMRHVRKKCGVMSYGNWDKLLNFPWLRSFICKT